MRKTQVRSGARDSYFGLVKQLPLRTIKTDQQYNAAREFLVTTTMAHQNSLDQGVLEYIETLATLIENYEKENRHGPDLSSLTPVSAISHLMEVHKLTVTEMAKAMGTSQGTLSDIRQGKRGVSKEMIRRLVDRFGVDARIFL